MCGRVRPRKFGTRYLNSLAVDKRGFDTYYEGPEIAYALQVTDVWEYENPIAHGFKSSQLTVETAQELIDLIDGEMLQELDNEVED